MITKEVDIKCPDCGKIFKVTAEAYRKNLTIYCPINGGKSFKPKNNEANKSS